MTLTERARLGHMVIGPERLEKLTARCADGLALRFGWTMEAARKYAQTCVEELHPDAVLAVGQVWTPRDGKQLAGADVVEALTGLKADQSYTVSGFTPDGMVAVGDGSYHLGMHLFSVMWLTAWPEDSDWEDDGPQPPQEPIAEVNPEPVGKGEEFDPRSLWVMAGKVADGGLPMGEAIPLVGQFYRAVNFHKPEFPPGYGNALDVPAYLAEHLADYRAGWADFKAEFNDDEWFSHFNALDDGCEVDVAVAAWLGRWLWERVRVDVVAEHGGVVAGYDVMFQWSPGMADVVIEAAPYAHPEWEIPSDHRLAQCDGQTALPVFAADVTP